MELRRSIVFSIILHTTLIFAAFTSFSRDTVTRISENYMIVSLFKEIAGIDSISFKKTEKNKISPSDYPTPKTTRVNENFNDRDSDSLITPDENTAHTFLLDAPYQNMDQVLKKSANQHAGISKEINMSDFNIEDNEKNPPLSPISKEVMGELSTKNILAQETKDLYDLIRAAIEKAKIYPFLARKKRIEGTVITGFTINNKGYPQDIKIARSSGSEILDSAAVKIVIKAAPFPEVNGKIVVPITFKLTDSTLSSR